MYYVYALIDPRDNLPFYIGKGKKNRTDMHFFPSMKDHNRYKDNIIAKIKSLGLEIIVTKIYEDIESENDAYEIEAALIKSLGRRNIDPGGILTNICIDNRPPTNRGDKAHQYDHTIRKYINVSGDIFIGTQYDFTKYSTLSRVTVSQLTSKKFKSAKGWYLEGTDPTKIGRNIPNPDHRDQKIYTFLNKNGDVFVGTQFDFRQKYSLSAPQISTLIHGRIKTIRDWYLKGTDLNINRDQSSYQYDKTIRTFLHKNGETFIGTRYDFSEKYNFSLHGIARMISGQRSSYKKWSLLKELSP